MKYNLIICKQKLYLYLTELFEIQSDVKWHVND